MALTLLDIARDKKDNFAREVVETYARECDILTKLPLATIGTTEVGARRSNSVPTVGWRKRGEAFGEVTFGGYDEIADATFPMGGNIDIDKTDMRDKNANNGEGNILSDRAREATKGLSWEFNRVFVNGDHGIDEDTFEGIKVRLANAPAAQTVYAKTSTAHLDLATALTNSTTGTLYSFMDRVDSAISVLDGHKADVCLTNSDGISAFKAVGRRLGLYKDSMGVYEGETQGSNQRRSSADVVNKPVFTYEGVLFYDMGLQRDQSTEVIGSETFDSKSTTPFYFMKLGHPYVSGIQQYAMEVSKPYMLPDGVTWRIGLDWPVGIRTVHPKSISALKGTLVP